MYQQRNANHQRASMADIVNPDNGYRGKLNRIGVKPKNHMRDNLKEIRFIEEKNREERELNLERESSKTVFKLSQFKDVEARLYEINETNVPKVGNFLIKNQMKKRQQDIAEENRQIRDSLDAKMDEARYYAQNPESPRKQATHRETAKLAVRKDIDFITQNRIRNQIAATSKKKDEEIITAKHKEFGKVPEYLVMRNKKLVEDELEMERRKPDPDCPFGMCLMHEEERLSTLDTLCCSKTEITNKLNSLPFIIETPSLIKNKSDMEMKLREIDKAISLFNKTKVYVRLQTR